MRPTASAQTLRLILCVLLLACLAAGCTPAMRGSMALANGDYAQALAHYHEAQQKDPDSLYLRQRIGLTYFAMKDYAKAEASFQDILNRAPGEPNALFYLGLARIGKGERQAALTELRAFRWPFKFYQQKFVQEEALRLLGHPDMAPDETIRSLQDALEQGTLEQDRYEREMENMLN